MFRNLTLNWESHGHQIIDGTHLPRSFYTSSVRLSRKKLLWNKCLIQLSWMLPRARHIMSTWMWFSKT
jgi:hypothetical protein